MMVVAKAIVPAAALLLLTLGSVVVNTKNLKVHLGQISNGGEFASWVGPDSSEDIDAPSYYDGAGEGASEDADDEYESRETEEEERPPIFPLQTIEEERPPIPIAADVSNVGASPRACLRARNDTVPISLYGKLPKPYVNLGFPKMGTSSLHAYFSCGGLVSTHYKCGRGSKKCGVCTRESVEAGSPPLAQCGAADVYAQMDDGMYFPQIELLEEFVRGHPEATFFLTFRNMSKWYHSISHWPPRKNGPHMDERFKKLNITGSPTRATKSNPQEFEDWYCSHVKRVRDIVARNPSHTLVEVDIEDPEIGQRMEDTFGIRKSCWGHANVNINIHADVNASEVGVSKHFTKTARREDAMRAKAAKEEMKQRVAATR
ncbi:hypothetical protein ACHAXT_008829 [Thalassiosira profunda]